MKALFGARMARFDLLRATQGLASRVTQKAWLNDEFLRLYAGAAAIISCQAIDKPPPHEPPPLPAPATPPPVPPWRLPSAQQLGAKPKAKGRSTSRRRRTRSGASAAKPQLKPPPKEKKNAACFALWLRLYCPPTQVAGADAIVLFLLKSGLFALGASNELLQPRPRATILAPCRDIGSKHQTEKLAGCRPSAWSCRRRLGSCRCLLVSCA